MEAARRRAAQERQRPRQPAQAHATQPWPGPQAEEALLGAAGAAERAQAMSGRRRCYDTCNNRLPTHMLTPPHFSVLRLLALLWLL